MIVVLRTPLVQVAPLRAADIFGAGTVLIDRRQAGCSAPLAGTEARQDCCSQRAARLAHGRATSPPVLVSTFPLRPSRRDLPAATFPQGPCMVAPFFMFATGIENSAPTIQNGRVRVDQMEKCRHYKYFKEDFALTVDLGTQYLRYGPQIHKTFLGPDRFDWSFADEAFAEIFALGLTPIVDLCHFGVPDWIGDFQNPDFPELFERYAAAFAARYPWVQLYTPINEIFICATFSARYGWWNEQLKTDHGFVTALKHLCKANVMAMHAILDVRPDAIFVQSESSEYFHAENPRALAHAETMNAQRFLPLDLNYGRRVNSTTYEFLLDNGMTREEYNFFLTHNLKHHCIMGNDYYRTNEHLVHEDGSTRASGEIFGYNEITRQYYDRYRLPVMHTETNLVEGPNGDEAVVWLRKQWANVLRVRNSGVPIVGFTWYSLTDQVDWDVALREENNRVNPLGLYDLDRNIRAVGLAYRNLIQDWSQVLPAQSVCLSVPLVAPNEYNEEFAKRRRTALLRHRINSMILAQPPADDSF
jgi:beta-glucosidase/6-phospho-beta-glucosidase/beta-galactosidase